MAWSSAMATKAWKRRLEIARGRPMVSILLSPDRLAFCEEIGIKHELYLLRWLVFTSGGARVRATV